jgi:hypothetical protein
MRERFLVILFSLAVLAIQITSLAAEMQDIPQWVNEVRSNVSRAFHTTVETSFTNRRDHVDRKEYSVFRLHGEGSLKKVSDPFETMRKLFPAANGWKEDLQYAADGHGSSSFAFRKETYFCIASVWIDSSCEDDETDHMPSVFWFSIDCRESNIIQR